MNANTLKLDAEIIIVGGGPAGATAAYYLAKAGHRVLVLDRQSFPRDKVCGDFVSPLTIKELQDMSITQLPDFQSTNIINKATVYLDGKNLITSPMPVLAGLEQSGRVIPRKQLDSWIFNAAKTAGANIMENMLVTGYLVEKDCVKVTAQDSAGIHVFNADLLIAADGSNSLVARKLRGYAVPKANRIIGVRGYFENVEGAANEADMHFASESFPGYCWLFPTGKGEANVGVGVLLETIPKGNQPKELLMQLIKEDEGLKRRLKDAKLKGTLDAWPLNTYDSHLPIIGNRVMLIGEAAGLVNPINGEGIQYALLSGRWAAENAEACLRSGDFSENALSFYSERVHTELSYGFKLSALIIQLIRNRNLNLLWLQAFETMVARARNDPQYANLAGAILAGLLPPTEGLNSDFMARTLQEAAFSTGMHIASDTLLDPIKIPKNILKIAQTGVEVAADTVANPFGFLQWSLDTMAKTFEFTVAVPNQLVKNKEKQTTESHRF